MKKKLLLVSIIPIIILFKLYNPTSSETNSQTHALEEKTMPPAKKWKVTLNGVDSAKAYDMKRYFWANKGQDKHPEQQSVWFDIVTIRNMVNMMLKERKEHPEISKTTKGYIDGIRIYFTNDGSITSGHLNNSIILVSTKYAGVNAKTSKTLHLDYYQHDHNDVLFKNGLLVIRGQTLKRQLINTRGENLYDIFGLNDKTPCDDDHYTIRGEGHEMANDFGKDSIRTKSEWFDLRMFRNLSKDTVVDGIRADGLRIYFVRHPVKYRGKGDVDKLKEAFMITTTHQTKGLSGKTIHTDYFNCLNRKEFYMKLNGVKPYAATGQGGDDKGELCPDACNPGDCTGDGATAKLKQVTTKKGL